MTSYQDRVREALEAFRKVCVNKTNGPGFEQTLAAIIQATEGVVPETKDVSLKPTTFEYYKNRGHNACRDEMINAIRGREN